MKSISKEIPPKNILLKVSHKINGSGAPEREGWETTGYFRTNSWSLKQNENKTVDFRNPTHWDYIE